MRSAEQVRWDFVQQWLGKAEQDLAAARRLFGSGMEHFENVGFHQSYPSLRPAPVPALRNLPAAPSC